MSDNKILTPSGNLKVLISTEDRSLTSELISGKSELQTKSMEKEEIVIKPMKVNEETVLHSIESKKNYFSSKRE